MLSIEVARLFFHGADQRIKIQGLLMMDSLCPWAPQYRNRGRIRPSYRSTTSDAVKEKVNDSFDNARQMILDWPQPEPFSIPPAVMLRAAESMSIKNSPDGIEKSRCCRGCASSLPDLTNIEEIHWPARVLVRSKEGSPAARVHCSDHSEGLLATQFVHGGP